MTPEARIQAAIDILDQIVDGDPAERALTNWSRRSRYAGSKDRAAIRDLVFSALRKWRSTAALGGAETGRGRMIGLLRQDGVALDTVFTGNRFAPDPLRAEELEGGTQPSDAAAMDLPDWVWEKFKSDLGDRAADAAQVLRDRAPVTLRVNTLKGDVATAQSHLSSEGITTRANPKSATALTVEDGQRKVAQSDAYQSGLVELQDASSQAIVDALPDRQPQNILDYCAGGGGKSLALAARFPDARIIAHDAFPQRMKDIPARASRAGTTVKIANKPEGRFDLVFCDVPCSGSGTWRRAPEAKWRFSPEDLQDLVGTQAEILHIASGLVSEGGLLAYATCSILDDENTKQIDRFLADNPQWHVLKSEFYLPDADGDGFFVTILTRD